VLWRSEIRINLKIDAGVAFVSAVKYVSINDSEGSILVSAHASTVYGTSLKITNFFSLNLLLPIILVPRVVTGEKKSPTVAHACRKRRLKWVLGAWGYNWATHSPGNTNIEILSSRLGVGPGADDLAPEKVKS
jgi:hypothetical protein